MPADDIIENRTGEENAEKPVSKSGTWLAEVKSAQKNQEKWHEAGRKIVRRFLDRRDHIQENFNKINLFTSNTQILISTLYARFPKPMVTREFEDPNDDVARTAAEIIERMLKVRPRDDFDSAMRNVVQDRLVPGGGTIWMRYEPTIEERQTEAVIDPMTGQTLVEASTYEEVTDEKVCTDYVFWEDILWSPARTWEEVRWIGRKVKMTKLDVSERFGEEVAARLTYAKMTVSGTEKEGVESEGPENDEVSYATVYEIWCKRKKKVYWVSPGYDWVLDEKDDPLRLTKFFPTPKFLFALTSTSNYMPRPDFLLAQDQYEELDQVNNRITWLERAIKVIGVYDGNNSEIERIFTEGVDNKIIPTRSFKEFMEKGGFRGSMDWIPIEPIVNALERLRTYRQDLIQQIYELTGISDIMRGSTKASETLGAQQLKAQYGSVKLQHLQMEVAAFVEEAMQIKAEIIREFYSPENIARISNAEFIYDPELIGPAIQLIKSPAFEYRVEVQADSMAVPEFNAERDGRMAYIRALSEMMTAAAPILQQEPQAGVAMLEIVKWGAASFRTGRQIEGVLDKAIQAISRAAQTPPAPPPPDPEKVAKAKASDAKAELDKSKAVQTDIENVMAIGPAALALKTNIGSAGVPPTTPAAGPQGPNVMPPQ